MTKTFLKQKILASVMLFFTLAEVIRVPVAVAADFGFLQNFLGSVTVEKPVGSKVQDNINIVAILVADDLMNDKTAYDGLSGQYPNSLKARDLASRVERYAMDVQRSMPFTRALIVKVKADESVPSIVDTLEKLYFDGDGKTINGSDLQKTLNSAEADEISKLSGVVIIGDVPLPVVNKNGNHFVSLLPYTDFENKAYVYDASSGDFLPNKDSTSSQPEVWSGVIKPPVAGDEGNKLLASYFDKNYLYHCSDSDCQPDAAAYKAFSRKLMFANFWNEAKSLNQTGFLNYLKKLNLWEDISYNRWSKKVAGNLTKDLLKNTGIGSISDDLLPNDYDPDNDGKVHEDLAGENTGRYDANLKKTVPDGCPGVCGVDEDNDSVDGDSDGYPDGYEREIGSLLPGGLNSPTDPKSSGSFPLDLSKAIPLPRTSPAPEAHWWIDEGTTFKDRPYNRQLPLPDDVFYTKYYVAGYNCKNVPDYNNQTEFNRFAASCVGNPNDDDEDGRVDEEADKDKHKGESQNHITGSVSDEVSNSIPDIVTEALIEKFAPDYNSLFDKFFSNINDWSTYTGRYKSSYTTSGGVQKSDISTIPTLITTKDETVRTYLRRVNDKIENIMDGIATSDLAVKMPLLRDSKIVVTKVVLSNPPKTLTSTDFQADTASPKYEPLTFINFSYSPAKTVLNGVDTTINNLVIYGTPASDIKSVNQCTLYRGSVGITGGFSFLNNNSSMVVASTLYDVGKTVDPVDTPSYSGCLRDNASHPEYCFKDLATTPIFSILGTKQVTSVLPSDYRDCFDFKEKNSFDTYKTTVTNFLKKISNVPYKGNEAAIDTIDKAEWPVSPYLSADKIKVLDYNEIDPFNPSAPPKFSLVVTLQQLIKFFGAYDMVDNNMNGKMDELDMGAEDSEAYGIRDTDYKNLGDRLLKGTIVSGQIAKPKDYIFKNVKKFFPSELANVDEIDFTVEPEMALDSAGNPIMISTLDTHKEPTDKTIEVQKSALASPESLPIDNPRYFSFMDQSGKKQTVYYPNLFAYKSFDELYSALQRMEDKLNKLGNTTKYTGALTAVIKTKPTFYKGAQTRLNIYTTYEDAQTRLKIYTTSADQLKDAYLWKNLNIDEKHDYVTNYYLNPEKNAFYGESAHGYEMLYLLADGDSSKMLMSFNKDVPETDPDTELASIDNTKQPIKADDGGNGGSGNGGSGAGGSGAGGSGSSSGGGGQQGNQSGSSSSNNDDSDTPDDNYAVNVLQWFKAIVKWVKDTSTMNFDKGANVCAVGDKIKEEAAAQAAGNAQTDTAPGTTISTGNKPAPSVIFGDNSSNNNADKEKTVKLRISADKTVADPSNSDVINITVEALNTNSQVNKDDSYNSVTLNIRNAIGGISRSNTLVKKVGTTSTQLDPVDIFSITPDLTEKIVDGEAKFQLMTNDKVGKVKLSASLKGTKSVISNSLELESTKRKINLTTYKYSEKRTYIKASSNGFVIKDNVDKVIANVNSKTGMVDVIDDRFELKALPSKGNKAARLVVSEKSSGIIIASVFFVVDGSKNVQIDSKETDYQKNFSAYEGVHIKDLDSKDVFSVKSVAADDKYNGGGVYLMTDKKVGEVDKYGNIFLAGEYYLQLNLDGISTSANNDNAVIFDVVDKDGKKLFEIYIGDKVPAISVEKEDGEYKDFNAKISFNVVKTVALNTFLNVAHAAEKVPAISDIEELIIGLPLSKSNDERNKINDLLYKNLNPLNPSNSLFTDLTIFSKGFKDIIKLYKRGVVSGYSDGTYKPDKSLTREEFVKLDLGAVCINCTKFGDLTKKAVDNVYNRLPFPDKNISSELQYCVKEAKNQGIVSGYKGGDYAGFFLPGSMISRAEATKVILETVNKQTGNMFAVSDKVVNGQPWYYNYVIQAQKQKLYPRGSLIELDTLSSDDFKKWFDGEIKKNNSTLINWLTAPISRTEFAMMVSLMTDKYDCMKQDSDSDEVPDNIEKYIYGTDAYNADSDGGGVKDFDEIKAGTNPLDAKDDKSLNDPDNDGLTNDEEKKYGTDPSKADTDGGGVKDGDEIKNGTNPLDSHDDDTDHDGMPNYWENEHGLNPNNASDALLDPDKDGLSNIDEYKHNTDPQKADTDGGGVSDGDEVLIQGTNPLTKTDDHVQTNTTNGGYIVGNTVDNKYSYEQTDSKALGQEQDRLYTNEIDADGTDTLFVKASLIDDDGNIVTDNSKDFVHFVITEGEDFANFDPSDIYSIRLSNGEAVVSVKSKTAAGKVKLSAYIEGKLYPVDDKEINVLPLEPSRVEIYSASPIIKSGGLSNTTVTAVLKDKNGNVCNNDYHQLTFLVNGPGTLDDKLDQDKNMEGVQIGGIDGKASITITSANTAGTITVTARYDKPEQTDESSSPIIGDSGADINNSVVSENAKGDLFSKLAVGALKQAENVIIGLIANQILISSRDNLQLTIQAVDDKGNALAGTDLPSDGKSAVNLIVKVVDQSGKIVTYFNNTVSFGLSDNKYGKIIGDKLVDIHDGFASTKFQSLLSSGDTTISATVPGFLPATIKIRTLPGISRKIAFDSLVDSIPADDKTEITLSGKLYDADGNFAFNDSTTKVQLRLTDLSTKYAFWKDETTKSTISVIADKGVFKAIIIGKTLSGPINIIAKSDRSDVLPAKLETKSMKVITAQDFKEMKPDALYSDLLGGDYGNVTKDNYLAGWFLFSGRAQAVNTLITPSKAKERVVEVSADGKISVKDTNNIATKVVPDNGSDSANKVILYDAVKFDNIAEVSVIMPKDSSVSILNTGASIDSSIPKTYIQLTEESSSYKLVSTQNSISLVKNGNEIMRLDNRGGIKMMDNGLQANLSSDDSTKYLVLNLTDGGQSIANIFYVTTFSSLIKNNVNLLNLTDSINLNDDKYSAGVYVKALQLNNEHAFETAFSGNSTAQATGVYITGTNDLSEDKLPGQTKPSLEKALDVEGIGFVGDNKHALLFAGGNNAGESGLPYASEAQVIIGDPTIRLNNQNTLSISDKSRSSIFTKDIGSEIYYSTEPVQDLTAIDYNSDGLKDVLVSYSDGQVRLLQNTNGYPRLKDKGLLLNIPNGIVALAAGDFNNDKQEDLVIATQDSCKKGEVCIDLFENHGGNFVRKHLSLTAFTEKNKLYAMSAADVNGDGYTDLITSDDSGSIRVFYNVNGQLDFEPNGQFIGNLGIKVTPNENLSNEVLAYYDEMTKNGPDSFDDDNFSTLTIPDDTKQNTESTESTLKMLNSLDLNQQVSASKAYEFIRLKADQNLGLQSTKTVKDLTSTGTTVSRGDTIEYSIKLVNKSNKDINDIKISDIAPDLLNFDKESIKCVDCKKSIKIIETGQSLRPYVLSNIDLPANGTRTIVYQGKVKETPKVKLLVGKNLNSNISNNNYVEIGASPEGNSTGRMVYYYASSIKKENVSKTQTDGSVQSASVNKITYSTYINPPAATQNTGGTIDYKKYAEDVTKDSDGDGVPDYVKNYQANKNSSQSISLDSIANNLESKVNEYTCSGGCIPMPINYALLAPGPINAAGTPVGYDLGIPVFAAGIPSIIFVWPPSPYQASFFRMYLSPTLTMSLGYGFCFGPWLGGTCFAFASKSPLSSLGVNCDAIANGIDNAMANATEAIQSTTGETVINGDPSSTGADANGQQDTGGFGGDQQLGDYHVKISGKTNFRVPGFPTVITDWFDRQLQEIITKLTDLPDLYVFLPDPLSVVGSVVPQDGEPSPNLGGFVGNTTIADKFKTRWSKTKLSNPRDFLSFLNAIPLVKIEPKDVLLKIPALSNKEIRKLQNDMTQWLSDERTELNRAMREWSCGYMGQFDETLDPTDWQFIGGDYDTELTDAQNKLSELQKQLAAEKDKDKKKSLETQVESQKQQVVYFQEILQAQKEYDAAEKSGNEQDIKIKKTVLENLQKSHFDTSRATICEKLIVDSKKLVKGVQKNIEVLNKYKEFPRKILDWRSIQAKYLNQIVCYFDAITNLIGGYTSRQMKIIEGWMEAARKIMQAIKDFKVIIDLQIDLNASCDKCSTQRFSLFELLVKLFMVIPSPPVIPFPKLPDIYFDLSNVQAGLTIVWPDLKFKAEPITIPKLPRIYLPSLPSVSIVLPDIPVLPEPPNIPPLPDLPALTLPKLPDLPPAPKLPSLMPVSIKKAVDILRKIFKILCIIKNGFMPIPEMSLKSQIEMLTERGLNPLLPIDLGLNVQYPAIDIPAGIPSKIEVGSYLNLKLNFDPIYNFVNSFATKANKITTSKVKQFNKLIQKVFDAAQKATDAANAASKKATGGDKTYSVSLNTVNQNGITKTKEESLSTLLKDIKQIQPDLGKQVAEATNLNNLISKDIETYKNYNETIKDYHLEIKFEQLDKNSSILNRTIKEVKKDIALEDYQVQTDAQKKLISFRSGLIDYADSQDKIGQKLNTITDPNEFATILAEAPLLSSHIIKDNVNAEQKYMASLEGLSGFVKTNGNNQNSSDQFDLAKFGQSAIKEFNTKLKYIASVGSTDTSAAVKNAGVATAKPIGIFMVDKNSGTSYKVVANTADADQPVKLLFIDVDNDKDNDLIYAYGGNVFFKENYKENPSSGYSRQIEDDIRTVTLDSSIKPVLPAINNFKANYENNNYVQLSWTPENSDISGYEITYELAKDAFYQNLKTKSHKVAVLLNSNDIAIDNNESSEERFNIDKQYKPYMLANGIIGNVTISGPKRELYENGSFTANPKQTIHALQDTELSISYNGNEAKKLILANNTSFDVSDEYSQGGLYIKVNKGGVELIDSSTSIENQNLKNGMMITPNDIVYAPVNASINIQLGDGSYLSAFNNEDIVFKPLSAKDTTSIELETPNGFYYSKIRSFNHSGFRSTSSNIELMAPTICADKEQPLPAVDSINKKVSIFKTVTIDASASFDANSKVKAYWIDTDLNKDDDNDGDPTDDKNLGSDTDYNVDSDGDGITWNDLDNPIFKLGPYKTLGDRKVRLNITDEANNKAGQDVLISVYVPTISVDEITSTKGKITGSISPKDDEIPVSLIRNRNGEISKINTPSANTGSIKGKYFTDKNGQFSVSDLNLKDSLVIKNSKGEIVATLNPTNGQTLIDNKNYNSSILAAEKPLWPTRLVVKDEKGQIINTTLIIPDQNVDAVIDKNDQEYNSATTALMTGVHTKDTETTDEFEFRKIPADDKNYPGGIEIYNSKTSVRETVVDSGGNIYIIDPKISIKQKAAISLEEPLIIEVYYINPKDGKNYKLGEIYIATGHKNNMNFLPTSKYGVLAQDNHPIDKTKDSDKDGIPDFWEQLYGLNPNDPSDANKDNDGDGLSNLEEYKVGGNPLNKDSNGNGIDDSKELVYGRMPGEKEVSPFTDVTEDNPYYRSMMNLFERNILKGIPLGNKLIFGAKEAITRAEFSKMMLDIFCIIPRKEAYEGDSPFTDINYIPGALPWFYAIVKEAYFQGFVTGYLGEQDQTTHKSPFKPDNSISKAEVVKVILEALERNHVIKLDNIQQSTPWYNAYIQVAEDLTPYLVDKSKLKQVYVITKDEAQNPENPVSRELFLAMADRVLTTFDCSVIDGDHDGMPDYWERLNGLNPNDPKDADLDPDGDGLSNLQEYKHGTDPHNPDTDGGGVKDGDEVNKGTNPLNEKDDDIDGDGLSDYDEKNTYHTDPNEADTDKGGVNDGDEVKKGSNPLNANDDKDTDGDGLSDYDEKNIYHTDPNEADTDKGGVNDGDEVKRGTDPLNKSDDKLDPRADLPEGIYDILSECTKCPCSASISHTADLIPGDKVFGIISNEDDSQVFNKSNEVTITEIPLNDVQTSQE